MLKPNQEMSPERKAGIERGCPACQEGRAHDPLYGEGGDWKYHPKAGKGLDERLIKV